MFGIVSKTLLNRNLVRQFRSFKFRRHKKLLNSSATHSVITDLPKEFATKTDLKPKIPVLHDSENAYIYNILQSIPVVDRNLFCFAPSNKVVTTLDDFERVLDQNWRSKTIGEIVEAFKSVANFCIVSNINVSDTRFDKLVDGLMDHVQDLTDAQLSELLTCFTTYPPCESYKSHNFHDVWSALDDMCCWRINEWTRPTMFWFAELWYKWKLGKLSEFMYVFMQRLDRRVVKLTKQELLHAYFYIKILKRKEIPFEYQGHLSTIIEGMSLDEIAVAATTLSKNEIKPKFASSCEVMIKRLETNLAQASDFCIANVLQVLRYSSHVTLVDQLVNLLDHLVPEIDRLSNIACIHVALLGTTLQFFHKESLTKVSQKIAANLEKARIKDLERLLVALTMFNYDPKTTPDIYKGIFEEIHKDGRVAELLRYPKCGPSILSFLSIRKLYSYELMDQVFHPEYIFEVYGKRPRGLSYDMFTLDVSREIECPDYKGARLDIAFRRAVAKWNTEFIPNRSGSYKLTLADKYLLEVMDTIEQIVPGPDFVYSDHIIPSYVKPDIVICKDHNGAFVKPTGFCKYTLGDVMYPPDTALKWYALVVLNWNMTARGTSNPLGLYVMKRRQLKTIGYEPILVISNEFVQLSKEEKIAYIRNKIR